MKKVTDKDSATFLGTNGYVAATLTWNSGKADKATNELFNKTKAPDFEVTNFDKDNVGNGSKLYFSFKPIYSKTSTSAEPDYGVYSLYKKVTPIYAASAVWEKVGDYSITATTLSAVDSTKLDTAASIKDGETQTPRVKSANENIKASSTSFALAGLDACIIADAKENDFNFSTTVDYKVVCKIDNVEIYSDVVTVTDKKVSVSFTTGLTGAATEVDKNNVLIVKDGSYSTEGTVASKEFTVVGKGYIKSVVPTLGSDKTIAGGTNKDNRIGFGATVEAKADASDATGKTWKVTLAPKAGGTGDVYAAAGDFVKITVTDAQNVPTEYTIKFVKAD